MKYIVIFSFDNRDKLKIRVEAKNQAEAIREIEKTPEIVDKLEELLEDTELMRVEIVPDKSIDTDDETTYSIQEVDGEKYLFRHDFPRFYARIVKGREPLTDYSWSDECDALTSATALRKAADFILEYRKKNKK